MKFQNPKNPSNIPKQSIVLLKTQENFKNELSTAKSFVFKNNYMANSIKMVLTQKNLSSQNPQYKGSHSKTLSHTRLSKPKIKLDTLSNIFSTPGLLENTKHSTFYQRRSISTISHQELVRDIALKNMNNSNYGKGNELRAKFTLNNQELEDLVLTKKKFFIKELPARHHTSNSMDVKTLEKNKKLLEKKEFEKERKLVNHDNSDNLSNMGYIFGLTHTHIGKYYQKTSEKLPLIKGFSPKKREKWRSKKLRAHNPAKNNHKTERNDGVEQKNSLESSENYKDSLESFRDLMDEVKDEQYPQYNKELGPSNKFLNLESLNRAKKQKDELKEVIKRKSIISPSDLNKFQSTLLSKKISDLLLNPAMKSGNFHNEQSDCSDESLDDLNENKRKSVKQMKEKTKKGKDLRNALRESLHYLASLKLDLKDLRTHKIFSSKPYEKPGSFELINACKHGNIFKVKELLIANRYLVYDYDFVYLTSLHWAAKRGEFDIAKVLIKYGADLNAKDLIGRTPLYLAIKHEKLDVMQLLLYHQADPWSTKFIDYKKIVAENHLASKILTKARQLNIVLKMTPAHQRKNIWLKDSWTILMNNNGKDEGLLRRIIA